MQIVIDIDDNLYTRLFDNGDEYVADMRRACVSIRNGKPLPKGHGRLIDADVFEKRVMSARSYYIGEKADDFDLRFAAGLKSAAERLVDAPAIIEADKAEGSGEECNY